MLHTKADQCRSTADSIAVLVNLEERLRLFGFMPDDLTIGRSIWTIIEPEVDRIVETQNLQWERCLVGTSTAETRAGIINALAKDYIRERYSAPDRYDWVLAAEQATKEAHAQGMPLSALLSATSAGVSIAFEISGRRLDCTKEERHQLNDVIIRLRSLECDVFSMLHGRIVESQAKRQRDMLTVAFEEGISATIAEAIGDCSALRAHADGSSQSARAMLELASEVAAAAEQSAVAMRGAAETSAGLIRAIEDARREVEVASAVTAKADGVDAPRRHLCARVEVLKHH